MQQHFGYVQQAVMTFDVFPKVIVKMNTWGLVTQRVLEISKAQNPPGVFLANEMNTQRKSILVIFIFVFYQIQLC